ncbi:4013_t:CDS:2 [Paraglomus occultum]|uniref:4013_t:CDS:1 n=1 Tax=Paraglomus occultum TaxID=144539 RepID=A0A9N9A8N8_9GLOM|nr:4013_t:CDS:2 [Paraglomus occultum]
MQQNRTLRRHTRTTLKNASSEILDYQKKLTQLMQDSPLPEDGEAPHKESTTAAKKSEEPRGEGAIVIASDSGNDLREASESMVGSLCHSDIMDMRSTSRFTNEISEESWNKFVLSTYPEYNLPKDWEIFIQEFFKPKVSLEEWISDWRELHNQKINGNKIHKGLADAIYHILAPYIEAFEAPYNILTSGDLRENQYNAQFVNSILKNTLKAICNIDWRILEVPVKSSKDRRNANINPIIDTVLEAKCADGLARLWLSHEEVFLYEQTGPPNFDDVTQLYVHDYKLIRTMRDVLNQRIILHLKDGIYDHKNLASFSAFGHRTEVSLLWLTIHQKSYCLREYGTFKIPTAWQDFPVFSEAIISCLKFFSFMRENIEVKRSYVEQKQKLLTKRRVHTIKQNQSSPGRPKKQKSK